MAQEMKIEALMETQKKIRDLKEFNIPVILKTIEEYKENGVEDLFIEQQKALLEKVNARLMELEDKARRLVNELEQEF